MKQYIREYPLFSLCGLNCGLCPRHHNYNDGKRKTFYCNAVNLLKLEDLKEIMREIQKEFCSKSDNKQIDEKSKITRKNSFFSMD